MGYASFYRSDGRTVKSSYGEVLTSSAEQVQSSYNVALLRTTVRLLLYGDLSGPGAFGPPLRVASKQTLRQAND